MRSECFPLPEGGLPWGHSAAWAPQGAGSSPQGCDTRCPLPLGLPRPHYGGRTRFILQHLNWPSRFPHSLPSPMHISRAADLHLGGGNFSPSPQNEQQTLVRGRGCRCRCGPALRAAGWSPLAPTFPRHSSLSACLRLAFDIPRPLPLPKFRPVYSSPDL